MFMKTILVSGVFAIAVLGSANAQTAATANPCEVDSSKCAVGSLRTSAIDPADQYSPDQIAEIKNSPQTILDNYGYGGPDMANHVATAVTSDISTLDSILSIVPNARPTQTAGIGAGLAQAAQAYEAGAAATNEGEKAASIRSAEHIANKVAETGDQRLIASYAMSSPDQEVAAIGSPSLVGARSAGGPAGPSSEPGNFGPTEELPEPGGPQEPEEYFSSTITGSIGNSGLIPVSPTF